MSEKSPAFQFYPKDYQTDGKVRMMSWEARAVYVDLLCTYWLEGTLPADPKRLATMVGMTPRRFEKLWPQIVVCFEIENANLKQKRLDREREKQKVHSEKQSENGKKGGKPKRISEPAKPEVIYDESQPEPEPEPKQSFPFASSSPAAAIPKSNPSSPSVNSQTDADAARSDLRKDIQALRVRQHAFSEKTDQQVLDCPVFHSTSGGVVRIDTCSSAGLMRATSEKVRAYGQPKPSKPPKMRNGDPWGYDPTPPEYVAAIDWIDAEGIPLLRSRSEIAPCAGRAPEAIRGHVEQILFARNPHLREPAQTRQTQTQEMQP